MFTPVVDMLRGGDSVIFPAPISKTLNGNGEFEVVLIATNDSDFIPVNWTYKVTFNLVDTAVSPFFISVPSGSDENLANIIPVTTSAGTLTLRGATGPGPSDAQVYSSLEDYFVANPLDPLVAMEVSTQVPASVASQVPAFLSTNPALITDPAAMAGASAGTTAVAEQAAQTSPLGYIDLWGGFFDNGANVWVPGQTFTFSTVTTVAAAAGASTVTLADVSGIIAGVSLVAAPNTATQQVMRVASVAGSVVTLVAPLVAAISAGQRIDALWQNEAHLSESSGAYAGYLALAKYVADALPADVTKVAILGNSWVFKGQSPYDCWAAAIGARFPTATVVPVGVGGNTTTMMLARFDADVPADCSHVVLFEWVNDTYQGVSASRQDANWRALLAKVRATGATPIVVGPVPLSAYPAQAVAQEAYAVRIMKAGVGGDLAAARVRATGTTVAIGSTAGKVVSGVANTLVGDGAAVALTTGATNTAVGQGALAACVVSSSNVAVGALAGASATGGNNVFVGEEAGQKPASIVGNESVLGAGCTYLGFQTGKGVPAGTTINYATAIGHRVTVSSNGGFAIGTSATGIGASTSTTDNEGVIGTAAHTVIVPGFLQVNRYQGSVGTAGGAPALPSQPSTYVLVKVPGFPQLVVPAYKAA